MNDTIEITRYPNRRLYDRSRKAYVTLGDVETMVVGGQDIRVRDSKSDEDLTRVILTQIILERHPERMKMFPIAFLHNMLRADQISLNWMAAYLGKAKSVMDAFPGAMGTGAVGANLVPGVKFWQSLVSGPANSEATRQPTLDQPDHAGGGQPPLSPQQSSQLDMAEKLAEMEQRLQQLEGGSNEDEANA